MALSSGTVMAQEAEAEAEADVVVEDFNTIVVTGTLIRGVEATGSQTIGVNQEEIEAIGASTTNELLGNIPQVSNIFNERFDGDPRSADRIQINRPNLRNLPGVFATTGSNTLILVDGHRMVPLGVDTASFDPDFISQGAIRNVEVVTDGGSSLYGADAVGGVINFITLNDFDGLKLGGTVEVGDEYEAFGLNGTVGTTWDTGSAFFTIDYYDRGDLLNSDRDWAFVGRFDDPDSNVATPTGSECRIPVGVETRYFFFGAGFTDNPAAPGAGDFPLGSPCDTNAESTLLPSLERVNAFAGFETDLSDRLSLKVKGHFGDASSSFKRYPLGDTFSAPAPVPDGTESIGDIVSTFSVGFSYEPNAAYVDRDLTTHLRAYGVAPELTYSFAGDWQARGLVYYGRSENTRNQPTTDRSAFLAAVNSGDLDPQNVAAADASVINTILNSEVAGETIHELWIGRLVLDGPVFSLGGNDVRAAIGAEYNNNAVKTRSDQVPRGGLVGIPFTEDDRDVYSLFAELSVPIGTFADLSLSGRYDDYSDFGSTFNPNIGLSVEPTDGLRIFGHWGESYNAPTALDSVRPANARFFASAIGGVPDPNGEVVDPSRTDVLLLEGSGGALEPQEAETWSVGAEFEPVSSLRIGLNYYNIEYTNLLSAVNPQLASVVLLNPDKFIFNPTQAEFNQYLAATTNGVQQFGDVDASNVGVIIDRRVANLDEASLEGIDFHVDYVRDLGAGELSVGFSGNHQINFDLTSSGTTVDQLEFDVSDVQVSAYIGYATGGFKSRVTVNYSGGFDTNTAELQDSVDGYTVTNLFLGYDFPEDSGALDGVSVKLNVDNVFDNDPPFWRRNQLPAYAFFSLGRVAKLSVSKQF